ASAPAPFGSAEWSGYLPGLRLALRTQPPDVDLPILPQLVDPAQARALLEGAIRAGSSRYVDITIESCTPQVMRYKPGSRCTILYHLSYPPELAAGHDWPAFVVAKTYQGKKGQTAYDGMRALWDSPLGQGDVVTVAEPLAFVPDLGLLIQGPIPGDRTLKDLIRAALRTGAPEVRDELHAYLRRTAAGLAALHQSGVQAGKVRDYGDALGELHEMIAELAPLVPDLPGAATPLLDRLTALAATYPPDAEGPAHGSFRPAQVLLHEGRVGFIDFDSFCRSEPARDLALFLSNIISVGLNTGADEDDDEPVDVAASLDYLAQLEGLAEVFLAQYAALAPISRPRLALWTAAMIFIQVLEYWAKVKPARLKNMIFLLERRLRADGLV
ncbi:MAG TPA: phosphotransferase, partial [Chloroflexia bacterium]